MRWISRRSFTLAAAGLIAAPRLAWTNPEKVPKLLDHILLGCTDLDAGIDYVYQRTGVRASPGGVHPGAGTRNALLSLGAMRYWEIIAPDPQQAASTDSRSLATLKGPALVGWAIHRRDLDDFAKQLRAAGIECGGPNPGSRSRPDGTTLRWKSLTLKDDRGGVLPFFIEWDGQSIHPSADSPAGCRLSELRIDTPDPTAIHALAAQLQLDVRIRHAPMQRLAATVVGHKGPVALESR